jgi:uncharacterized protein
MEYEDREESSNVEDRRGIGPRGLAVGGGGLGIVVVIVCLVFGIDPRNLMGPGGPIGQPGQGVQQGSTLDPKEEDKLAHFSKVIFHDTEVIWGEQFAKMGKKYVNPKLVLYTGQTETACGTGEAAVGPFYCPGDSKVYLDLSFFQLMTERLHASGDFAHAYVIAHEVGHHVQRLLGYSKQADGIHRSENANERSVRLELQADYFAGVWAHYGQEKYKFIDQKDFATALNAANQIGDDTLQKQARGTVRPETFTHGSSAQRVKWFKAGFDTGDVAGAKQLFDLPYGKL